jgi:hypothetical protein
VSTGETEARLRAHVAMLAGQTGERHVFRPHALVAAADYIAETWRAQGYRPEREPVAADGSTSANIVVKLPGRGRSAAILLIGAH